ncbi:DNRLRE domain-containing protein [Micromonospora sp. NPDC050276]|uniref:DNRLRE domain-containing protein n=1 Tax=Micromonospora sp. NPDC050276 TaxID=3364278 RepID=UPI0037A03389
MDDHSLLDLGGSVKRSRSVWGPLSRIPRLSRGPHGRAIAVVLSVLLAATMAEWVVAEPATAALPQPVEQPAATGPEVLERPDEAAAVATARMTNKKVRITGMTSETSEFWALPDGRVEAEVHAGPVRMRDAQSGAWKQVDFSLAPQLDGSVAAVAHPAGLRLSGATGSGEHDLVTLGREGESVSLGWTGALPAPTVAGNRATYAEVRPGVDLLVESTRTGFEQFLIVKDRAAVAQVRNLALPLTGKGLTLADDTRGGFEIKHASGETVGVSPEPVMWDAQVQPESGERLRKAKVGKKVGAAKAGRLALTLTPDEQWLTDPKTVFPVTIDPAVTLKPNYDAFVQTDYTSDQSAATELKLGTSDGGTVRVARSFLNFSGMTWLAGKQVQDAKLYLYNHYSWSCVARQWEAWRVDAVGTSTRWTNQPVWRERTGYTSTTKGYNSTCTGGWVNVPVTGVFAVTAGNGWSTANIGLRAASETDNLGWKRFHSMEGANDPYVTLTYQSPPTVNARATVPSTPCATGSATPYINTKTPQLRAQINDAEGSQVRAEFEWLTSGGTRIGGSTVGPGASGSWLAASVPAGAFTEGGTYSWRVRGNDGTADGAWSGNCSIIIDTIAPSAAPTVSSTTYPAGQWAGAAGTAGGFTFTASGVTDVAAYEYGLNTNPPNQTVNAPSLGANASVSITPTADGPQTLYVRTRDRAGNQSAIKTYTFNVGSGAITSPKEGDITAAKTAIAGVGQSSATGVTYQWRRGDADAWVSIPAGHVTVAAGGGAVTWPLASSGGGAFPKLNWDVEATLAAADAESIPRDGPLQLRGTFTGGTGGMSNPVKISFDRTQAAAESQQIGPGSVNLITGNLSMSKVDASVASLGPELTITRSYNTRRATVTDAANMYGPGWVSGAVVEGEAPYTSLTLYGSLVQVGTPEGETLGFTKRTSTAFESGVGAEFLELTYVTTNDSYRLVDEEGNSTVFTRVAGAAAGKYFPTSVTSSGSAQTTTVTWEKVVVAGKEVVRPTRVLAPVPTGVSCATLVRGCRVMTFSYATTTTATGGAEGSWGDFAGRVKEISFTAWDPDLATPAMRAVPMARYAYDDAGRLRASWDPRLDWDDNGTARHLQEVYTYNLDGLLSSSKPVGQEPWQLNYTTLPGDPASGRVYQVTRSALTAGTATTTVVYRVPVSGVGAPHDLSAGQTVRWGQPETPTDATAVFPPTQVPNGNPAAGARPSSYERATVTYLDANAREVNVAEPGGHISATWYDQWGNTVRTMTAGNRARALNARSTDDVAAETTLSRSQSTLHVHSVDGQRLTTTLEPEHEIMLPTGGTTRGRKATIYTYDEGAPVAEDPYNLVTRQAVVARVRDSNGVEADVDARTTTIAYDWGLRQPTVTTVDQGGLALATRTAFDPATELITSTTNPAGGTSTTTPATQKTIYYRAGSGSGHAECDLKPEWADLPCRVQPGGQPGSGPELPVMVTTYDMLGQPRVATEKTSAGTLRTTTTTYDSAGRVHETRTTAASGLGTVVPVKREVYNPATGEHVRTQSVVDGSVVAEVVRVYDTLGRVISYTDANGNVSTTTYDVMGRVATGQDGKAQRTYTYDGGSERRGLVTAVDDTEAGLFTGSYDADGNLTSETWPNGMVVNTEVDEVGDRVGLVYVKAGCPSGDCILYSESVVQSVHGQRRQGASSLSRQHFDYDKAGRLTVVQDTVGGQCTTRKYGLSTSSNRNSLTEYGPTAEGDCQSGDAASTRTWTYDTADRMTSAGYVYDALGRTRTVPEADTANPAGGDVTITYHATDLVDTITHNGRTTDYALDVTGERIRSWTDTAGGTTEQRTHHYSGDEDSPSWTQESADSFTRPIAGLTGIAAIFDSGDSTPEWQVANLHGDVIAGIHNGDQGLSWTSESTEYGAPRSADAAGSERYGWLGDKQRAADTPSGIVLMGARLYNPTTGRFLQVDPIYGGSCNSYEYTCADPVNQVDLDGKALPAVIGAVAAVLSLARAVMLACRIAKSWCVRALKYLVKKAKPYIWRAFWWTVGKAKVFTSNERVKRGLECGWAIYTLVSNARVGGYAAKTTAWVAGFVFGAITKWRCKAKGPYS